MYNAIPLWKPLGETKGAVFIKPDGEHYSFWHNWVKQKFPTEYEDAISRSSPKENIIRLIFKYLNISLKEYQTEHRRGIYFANIYENGRELLCGEIGEDELVVANKFQGDTEGIME